MQKKSMARRGGGGGGGGGGAFTDVSGSSCEFMTRHHVTRILPVVRVYVLSLKDL